VYSSRISVMFRSNVVSPSTGSKTMPDKKTSRSSSKHSELRIKNNLFQLLST
jgi:hypothetical protein